MQIPEAFALYTAVNSMCKSVFASQSCNLFLHNKWVTLVNEIDPNRGENLTYAHVIRLNEFAYGQLQQMHMSGMDSSATGLPLTDAERRRKKEVDQREKDKRAAERVSQAAAKGKGGGKKGEPTQTRTSPEAVASKGGGDYKKKSVSTTTGSWAGPCKFWDSSKGECTRGISCKFKHTGFKMFDEGGNLIKRCVTCGSRGHTHKECTRPGGGADPQHDAHWAEYRERKAREAPAAEAASGQQPKGSKGGGKGKKGKKGDGKAAANMTESASPSPTTPPTASPTPTPTTQGAQPGQRGAAVSQVAKLRKGGSRASPSVGDGPPGGALLDSGANVAVEYVTHLEKTHEVVPVTLASGEVATCTRKIGPKGMPTINMIAKHKNNILPLLWLIERHCELSSDWRTLSTPRRRHLPIIIDGELPYLNEDGVKTLMEDLPEAYEPGRSGTCAEMQINLVFSMRIRAAAVQAAGANLEQKGLNRDGSSPVRIASEPERDLTQECGTPPPPTPAVQIVRRPEERALRQARFRKLREIFEDGCKYPDIPSMNLRKNYTNTRLWTTNTTNGTMGNL